MGRRDVRPVKSEPFLTPPPRVLLGAPRVFPMCFPKMVEKDFWKWVYICVLLLSEEKNILMTSRPQKTFKKMRRNKPKQISMPFLLFFWRPSCTLSPSKKSTLTLSFISGRSFRGSFEPDFYFFEATFLWTKNILFVRWRANKPDVLFVFGQKKHARKGTSLVFSIVYLFFLGTSRFVTLYNKLHVISKYIFFWLVKASFFEDFPTSSQSHTHQAKKFYWDFCKGVLFFFCCF